MTKKEDRIQAGVQYFASGRVQHREEKVKIYKVKGREEYIVTHRLEPDTWECTCKDYTMNGYRCKHIWASIFFDAPSKEVL